MPTLLTVVTLLVMANLHAAEVLRSEEGVSQSTLLFHLSVDVLALTVFFLMAGGPANPFVMLYVVHVAMAATMMRAEYFVPLACLVLGCYGLLHVYSLPLHLGAHNTVSASTLATGGQVVAFLVTVVSMGGFQLGLANTLRKRSRQLKRARGQYVDPEETDEVPLPGTLPFEPRNLAT